MLFHWCIIVIECVESLNSYFLLERELTDQELEEMVISSEDVEIKHFALKKLLRTKTYKNLRKYLMKNGEYYRIKYYYFFKFAKYFSKYEELNGKLVVNNRASHCPPSKIQYYEWKPDKRCKINKYLTSGSIYATTQLKTTWQRGHYIWTPMILIIKNSNLTYEFRFYEVSS